eukprot:scaffold316652_cov37-Tisochrysis_lutea.AAC.1
MGFNGAPILYLPSSQVARNCGMGDLFLRSNPFLPLLQHEGGRAGGACHGRERVGTPSADASARDALRVSSVQVSHLAPDERALAAHQPAFPRQQEVNLSMRWPSDPSVMIGACGQSEHGMDRR